MICLASVKIGCGGFSIDTERLSFVNNVLSTIGGATGDVVTIDWSEAVGNPSVAYNTCKESWCRRLIK